MKVWGPTRSGAKRQIRIIPPLVGERGAPNAKHARIVGTRVGSGEAKSQTCPNIPAPQACPHDASRIPTSPVAGFFGYHTKNKFEKSAITFLAIEASYENARWGGVILGLLGATLANLGTMFGHLGAILADLGVMLGNLGQSLGHRLETRWLEIDFFIA